MRSCLIALDMFRFGGCARSERALTRDLACGRGTRPDAFVWPGRRDHADKGAVVFDRYSGITSRSRPYLSSASRAVEDSGGRKRALP